MTIHHPTWADVPQLKRIWLECFPEDGDGYCEFFFRHGFSPDRCMVLDNGDTYETVCYWFPAVLQTPSKRGKYPFWFIYACATSVRFRGKHNLRRLLEAVRQLGASQGQAGIYLAAAEELIPMYDRMGMKRTAELSTYTISQPESLSTVDVSWHRCPLENFTRLRNAHLEKLMPAFFWVDMSEQYMYDDVFTKGEVLLCEFSGEPRYAVCTRESDCLIVRETDFPLERADILLSSVCRHFHYAGETVLYCAQQGRATLPVQPKPLYYGHYMLNTTLSGSYELGNRAYVNLIAD